MIKYKGDGMLNILPPLEGESTSIKGKTDNYLLPKFHNILCKNQRDT